MPVGELAVLLIAALSVALLLCVSHRARLRQAGVMLVCRRMSPDLSPMVFIAAMERHRSLSPRRPRDWFSSSLSVITNNATSPPNLRVSFIPEVARNCCQHHGAKRPPNDHQLASIEARQ